MECLPRASVAVLDNGYNMVACLKVRIPGGRKYLVYDPQATGSGPTKYAISTSPTEIAKFMSRAITSTPTEGVHRLDYASFIEMKLIEEVDIDFQIALSQAVELSLQDTGRTNASSAGPSTIRRPRRYQSDQRISLPDVIPSEQEQLNRITEHYIAEARGATRPSVPNEDNALDGVESPANLQCGVCMEDQAENRIIRIPGCRHGFCKDCVKGTVQADIDSINFPIFCPVCRAARGTAKQGRVYLVIIPLAYILNLVPQKLTKDSYFDLGSRKAILIALKDYRRLKLELR